MRWYTKHGFVTGTFVRFNRNGAPVVSRPGRKEKAVDEIYPVNDGRMMAQRGRVTVSGYNEPSTTTTRRRSR